MGPQSLLQRLLKKDQQTIHAVTNSSRTVKHINVRSCNGLTLSMLGNFTCLFLTLADFLFTFSIKYPRIPECQKVWIHIKPNIISGMI